MIEIKSELLPCEQVAWLRKFISDILSHTTAEEGQMWEVNCLISESSYCKLQDFAEGRPQPDAAVLPDEIRNEIEWAVKYWLSSGCDKYEECEPEYQILRAFQKLLQAPILTQSQVRREALEEAAKVCAATFSRCEVSQRNVSTICAGRIRALIDGKGKK